MPSQNRTGGNPIEPLESRLLFATGPTAPLSSQFHLTAQPWQALNVKAADYLEKTERLVRVLAQHQNEEGRIIDPYINEEEKHATPFFAYAVGVLNAAGRARDLLDAGLLAMDASTRDLAETIDGSDDTGNNYLEPISGALKSYGPLVPAETLATWRARMTRPVEDLVDDNPNNHRAYAMKGQWARALAGLVTREEAIEYVEANWKSTQRDRILGDDLYLYHDRSSDPDSMVVDSVARVSLLWLLANEYDGPSRGEMETLLYNGTKSLLFLQDPTGQAPNGGRATNAVWNDSNAGVCFETMAVLSAAKGDTEAAAVYRRAANLAFQSIERWEFPDGTQPVLKNAFDPAERIGYARYNVWSNSNASQAYRFAYLSTLHDRAGSAAIGEAPAPAEVGGYAFDTDEDFSTAFANAGGMQMQASLRGEATKTHDRYWSVLGVTRFSQAGWDARLGQSGQREPGSGDAVSFAPSFLMNSQWHDLAELPENYSGRFSVQFTSPVLVRALIEYSPERSSQGPTFRHELVLTPDGVLSTLTSSAAPGTFGINWPIMTSDGKTALTNTFTAQTASVSFPGQADEQNYISLNQATTIDAAASPVRDALGDIRPIRVVSGEAANLTFVYPRRASQPAAAEVEESFAQTGGGFSTVLGRVVGNTYVGRNSAGGEGTGIDFDFDGVADMTFSENCIFVMQRLADGRITNIETDRPVTMNMSGRRFSLSAYEPLAVNLPAPPLTPGPTPDPDGDNAAPSVQASGPQNVLLPRSAQISAVVRDDGLPARGEISVNWTQVSGPGAVTFADPTAAQTTATLSAPGAYVLRVTTSDGQLTGTDEVTIVAELSTTTLVALDDRAVRSVSGAMVLNVLANDANLLTQPLVLSIVSQPTSGTAVLNDAGTPSDPADDTIVYTPAEGYFGDDSFTYRIANGSGGASDATVTLTLPAGASIVPDPRDASRTALLVVGSDAGENIKLARRGSQVRVLLNKTQIGQPLNMPNGSTILLAKGGDDTINLGALKNLPAIIFGGAGNDVLKGSKFSDLLIGGSGNDVIQGGAGNDLMIGGDGADALNGSGGDDILLAHASTYDDYTDNNLAALLALQASWNTPGGYAARVSAVTIASGASPRLANEVLLADQMADILNGAGGAELFFADPVADTVKSKRTETVVQVR